ncbi:hypothetical protein AKJ66_03435 [candidate division MSBL1 archaeon SCGC-AAA259E22]|uniref:Glutamate/phenylalanine/leucine/valine/L-tryptophan dehydrogenase C-terminal domain-containing protein n=1 Tax=candidate division MSBL1 archaeon SCGC-AAA259E22 TaxID=1698265 RepID=A0A133UF31_9EURY|nr:hypothetical protein AKJ66_03435 [candidate division MSBL1 archaeon SCGC-AAA259E22]
MSRKVFEALAEENHESIDFHYDNSTGLKALVAIHDTSLGIASGGTRVYNYESIEDALADALRLSKAMTYKNAAAGIDLGGGKAVIIGAPEDLTPQLFREYGRRLQMYKGKFSTGEDVGMSEERLKEVEKTTGNIITKDTSYETALGVVRGIEACIERLHGEPSLKEKTIAIRGYGNVGRKLARLLDEEGAKIIAVSDSQGGTVDWDGLNIEGLEKYKKEKSTVSGFQGSISNRKLLGLEVDIFSPCAVGGAINKETVSKLKCDIVAGASNNQLESPKLAKELKERHLLYAPDFVINAGGAIAAYGEIEGLKENEVLEKVSKIRKRMKRVIRNAETENISTVEASYRIAKNTLTKAREGGSSIAVA